MNKEFHNFEGWSPVANMFCCPDCGPGLVRDPRHDSRWACPKCGLESYCPSIFFTINNTNDMDFNEMETRSCT